MLDMTCANIGMGNMLDMTCAANRGMRIMMDMTSTAAILAYGTR